jgi:hypothetical protein
MDDAEGGSNPFWHAFLIVSKQEDTKEPIEIQEAIGFYSQPNTNMNPVVRAAKYMAGLDVDLSGGHGELRKEKMRYIDGNGIHGLSFDITKEKYGALLALFEQRMSAEKEAIKAANEYYKKMRIEPNGQNRLIRERAVAEITGSELRLKRFDITLNINAKGIDSSQSYDCKNYALEFLFETSIITEEDRKKILGNSFRHGLPRFNGVSIHPLRLVSTGESQRRMAPSSTCSKYSRSWEKNKLFLATSPIYMNSSKSDILANKIQQKKIKKVLTYAHQLETQLRHRIEEIGGISTREKSTSPADSFDERSRILIDQLTRVQSIYELFKNACDNKATATFNAALDTAENISNVATLSLEPKKVDYSFIFRAYQAISMRNALLGLLGLVLASTFIASPVGAVIATTAALFASNQIYKFFKEDLKFIKMREDYNHFFKQELGSPDLSDT